MIRGLDITFSVLRKTRNEAAVAVLVAGLDSRDLAVRRGALAALVHRRAPWGHLAILKQFDRLDDTELDVLRQSEKGMVEALRQAVLGDDDALAGQARQAIVQLAEYELIPTLLEAARKDLDARSQQAASALVELARMLHAEKLRGTSMRPLRRSHFVSRHVPGCFVDALDRYPDHPRREIVESYLTVTSHDHPALRRVLSEATHPAHACVVDLLRRSAAPEVIDLLVQFLLDTDAPDPVMDIIAERADVCFVDRLLTSLKHPVPLRAVKNAGRWQHVEWLEASRQLLLQLSGSAQAAAVELGDASALPPAQVFALLAMLMRQGAPEGRHRACEALSNFTGSESDKLVRWALEDSDPSVRAAAARQLRKRNFPNILPELIRMLDDGSSEVKEAAQTALTEFRFARYVSAFDQLSPQSRRQFGALVRKSDPNSIDQLIRELRSPSPTQKLRAIEMTVAMALVDKLCDTLVELLTDNDATLRVEAARALAESDAIDAQKALHAALDDAHPSVRRAAKSALAKIKERRSTSSSPLVAETRGAP